VPNANSFFTAGKHLDIGRSYGQVPAERR